MAQVLVGMEQAGDVVPATGPPVLFAAHFGFQLFEVVE